MECGEQCVVTMAGITMMPELCADNWDTMWTQVKVSLFTYSERLYRKIGIISTKENKHPRMQTLQLSLFFNQSESYYTFALLFSTN